jgi:hypothetical protein
MEVFKRASILVLFLFHWSWAGGDFPFPLSSDSNYALINAWQIQDMDNVVTLYQSHEPNQSWILAIQDVKTREFLAGKSISPTNQIIESLIWHDQTTFIELNLDAKSSESPGTLSLGDHKYQLFFNTIFCQSL